MMRRGRSTFATDQARAAMMAAILLPVALVLLSILGLTDLHQPEQAAPAKTETAGIEG